MAMTKEQKTVYRAVETICRMLVDDNDNLYVEAFPTDRLLSISACSTIGENAKLIGERGAMYWRTLKPLVEAIAYRQGVSCKLNVEGEKVEGYVSPKFLGDKDWTQKKIQKYFDAIFPLLFDLPYTVKVLPTGMNASLITLELDPREENNTPEMEEILSKLFFAHGAGNGRWLKVEFKTKAL